MLKQLQKITRLAKAEKYDEAIKLVLPLIEKEPKNDHLLFILGTLYISTERIKEAVEILKNAIFLNPP